MRTISVLGLNNNFYGSYASNQVFFEELVWAFQSIGVRVCTAATVEEARKIYESTTISFSFSFSKYQYYFNGRPLYEKYGVLNYQWVSDNPLKMRLDLESQWIKYIFIDREYPLVLDKSTKNGYLFRPLGFLQKNLIPPGNKNGRILFPCKVRNINKITDQIYNSPYRTLIKRFLREYDRAASFIIELTDFFREENIREYDKKEAIFRLANEYTRVEKRIWVLNQITDYPVDVLAEDYNNVIQNANIRFLQPISYSAMPKMINSYSYVVNVDPNYDDCIHDRFIKTVSSGSICITNSNKWISSITPATYTFDNPGSVMQAIMCAGNDRYIFYEKQLASIKKYSWEESARFVLEDFLRNRMEYEVSDKI